MNRIYVQLARTIYMVYIRCIFGTFGREIAKCTVIYGSGQPYIYGFHVQFQPTLGLKHPQHQSREQKGNCCCQTSSQEQQDRASGLFLAPMFLHKSSPNLILVD